MQMLFNCASFTRSHTLLYFIHLQVNIVHFCCQNMGKILKICTNLKYLDSLVMINIKTSLAKQLLLMCNTNMY